MTAEQPKSIMVRFEPTDLAALLRSSLTPLMAQAKEHAIELRVETLGDVRPLPVDPEKLAWGIATLVGNALRYVRRGNAERPGNKPTAGEAGVNARSLFFASCSEERS